MTDYNNSDLLGRVSNIVQEGLDRYAAGEQTEYAVSFAVFPGAEPGNLIGVILVAITMPGVVLGERSQAISTIVDLGVPNDKLDEMVRGMVEGLKKERSEFLADPKKTEGLSGLITPS